MSRVAELLAAMEAHGMGALAKGLGGDWEALGADEARPPAGTGSVAR